MFKIESIENNLAQEMETDIISNVVKISTKDGLNYCIMPQKFADQDLIRIKNMDIFEDDIWVVTYSKCGTTWAQEMMWMLNNNLDYETALKVKLHVRFPFIEWSGIWKNIVTDSFEECKNLRRPRYIKSHLPLFLLPDQLWTIKPKIIYVARNPKDTAISFYHHHKHMQMYKGSKENFIKAFVKDLIIYSPFNDHVLEFWKIRNESNVLFLFFEDMKRNLNQEVRKAMKFLGKYYNNEQIDKLCKHLSFESIRKNEMINRNEEMKTLKESFGEIYDPNEYSFVRKGQVGGYKDELSKEENEMLDKYCKYQKFVNFGFDYKY